MILSIELIKSYYDKLPHLIGEIRKNLGKPLTFSEKVLYAHLFDKTGFKPCERGVDYVDFAPDRVAMQDATAQMALLQFMMAGKDLFGSSRFGALRSSHNGKNRIGR